MVSEKNNITFIHATMVNENLLATYSLLPFIRESFGEDSGENLLGVFVPLVKAAFVWKLKDNHWEEYKSLMRNISS